MQTREALEKEDSSGGRRTRIKDRRSSFSSGVAVAVAVPAGEVIASPLSSPASRLPPPAWELGLGRT